MARVGKIECALIGLDRLAQQSRARIETAHAEICRGELRLQAEPDRRDVRRARLGLVRGGSDRIAHATEQIDLVGERGAERRLIVGRGQTGGERPVGGDARAFAGTADIDLGHQSRALLAEQATRLRIARGRRGEAGIVGLDPCLEPV